MCRVPVLLLLLALCALTSGCQESAAAVPDSPPLWSAQMQAEALDGLRAIRQQEQLLARIDGRLEGIEQRLDHLPTAPTAEIAALPVSATERLESSTPPENWVCGPNGCTLVQPAAASWLPTGSPANPPPVLTVVSRPRPAPVAHLALAATDVVRTVASVTIPGRNDWQPTRSTGRRTRRVAVLCRR